MTAGAMARDGLGERLQTSWISRHARRGSVDYGLQSTWMSPFLFGAEEEESKDGP